MVQDEFELLHRLRIKGRVAAADMETPPEVFEAATAAGYVKATPRGVLLTPSGLSRHREILAAQVGGSAQSVLERSYARFLQVNDTVKATCSRWQLAAPSADEDDLLKTVDELGSSLSRVGPSLITAGVEHPRFGRYRDRLEEALEGATKGDRDEIASPTKDSFHTVWFECHEDFLVSLGRDRGEEE